MKRVLLTAAAALFLAVACDSAHAQIPQFSAGPPAGSGGPTLQRSKAPVVSRYTGLLGSSVGVTGGVGYQYFTRVQPQQQAANAIGNLRSAVDKLQGGQTGSSAQSANPAFLQAAPQQGLGPTGHFVGYFSHRVYFGTSAAPAGFGTTGGGYGAGAGGYGAGMVGTPSAGVGAGGMYGSSALSPQGLRR
jgi:hypothetical protein